MAGAAGVMGVALARCLWSWLTTAARCKGRVFLAEGLVPGAAGVFFRRRAIAVRVADGAEEADLARVWERWSEVTAIAVRVVLLRFSALSGIPTFPLDDGLDVQIGWPNGIPIIRQDRACSVKVR